jgi:hypothetical protein
MKSILALLAAAVFVAGDSRLQAQTLDWGSRVFSDIVDSEGQTLDNTFLFQLGAFDPLFIPTEENMNQWVSNWRVFDQASYNPGIGYFANWSTETDTLRMLDDGTSNSPFETAGAPSFEGLTAYIWIRKGDQPVEGSEWLLTRASTWVFPNATPGCCDNELDVQWSVSDLDTHGETPLWGGYGTVEGPGVFTPSGPHDLQTYTFVPEPSSSLLAAAAGILTVLRRRRSVP